MLFNSFFTLVPLFIAFGNLLIVSLFLCNNGFIDFIPLTPGIAIPSFPWAIIVTIPMISPGLFLTFTVLFAAVFVIFMEIITLSPVTIRITPVTVITTILPLVLVKITVGLAAMMDNMPAVLVM